MRAEHDTDRPINWVTAGSVSLLTHSTHSTPRPHLLAAVRLTRSLFPLLYKNRLQVLRRLERAGAGTEGTVGGVGGDWREEGGGGGQISFVQ
ncbi:unnamed protein product [Danaus chrysippus]|uniref:(African queen) hypothetical protein n=1 Tax=Danaus chrysippus TaxID=151541 RepID=A0A8J2VY89_9NEOP|nr:unnamed protein product [Danaus chrysippus]